jgi:hypothetical protein
MLKKYFKTALRNLWKNKTFCFLNIAGLAIGIVSAALISTKDLANAELRRDKTVFERSELPLLFFVSLVFRDYTKNN